MKNKGFSLTEVIIGIFILTVAIVSASTLLNSLLRSNENNLTTIQANYFAMEGLEAVRNVRDSNWLNNFTWLDGEDSANVWGVRIEKGKKYSVALNLNAAGLGQQVDRAGLMNVAPFRFEPFTDLSGFVETLEDETRFRRYVELIDAPADLEEAVLVKSVVMWNVGSSEREVELFTILTNWKDGGF